VRERKRRCAYRVSVGTLDGRRPLERPKRRWKDNIKMVLEEVRWGKEWIDMAWDTDRW
jgi:hypothetical protein